MKVTFSIFLLFLSLLVSAQTEIDSTNFGDLYRITEVYYIQNDTSIFFSEVVDTATDVVFMKYKNDSTIISINRGFDNVYFLGYTTTMDNPGFNTSSEDAEYYHWNFTSHVKKGIRNADILKEYVTSSLENRGLKYYFIDVVFSDNTEYQFYVDIS